MNPDERKKELLARIQAERKRLEEMLAGLSREEFNLPGVCGHWSVKDIMAHLVAWERQFLSWYIAGLKGESPKPMTTKKEWDEFNRHIFETNCARGLEEISDEFKSSYQQVLTTVQAMSPEDLYTAHRFPWTGKFTLATFVGANTYHHYTWAQTQIRRWQTRR
jgi:hypothetical protein